MNILITGGTGTLGVELTTQLITNKKYNKIIIYSRDPIKQAKMRSLIDSNKVHYWIGDITDKSFLRNVIRSHNINTVIHAASLKHIDLVEIHFTESYRINVLGSLSVLEACIEEKVDKLLFTSTDKAVNPITLYGKEKSIIEDIYLLNGKCIHNKTKIYVTRYGNVFNSNNSVWEKWIKSYKEHNVIKVRNTNGTRFFFTQYEAARFIIDVLEYGRSGGLYIPYMESYRIQDIIDYFIEKGSNIQYLPEIKEKVNEELFTEGEEFNIQDSKLFTSPLIRNDLKRFSNVNVNLFKDNLEYLTGGK